MKYYSIILHLIILLFSVSNLNAQSAYYRPDTSLTFNEFVQQCLDFKAANRQEVWVVHFWASWNSNSLQNFPDLKYVKSQFQNFPVRFISVSEDKQRYKWESALKLSEMEWEHLIISNTDNLEYLKRAFPYKSLPAIFFVNTRGMIRRIYDIPDLKETLTNAAANLPASPYQKPPPSYASGQDYNYGDNNYSSGNSNNTAESNYNGTDNNSGYTPPPTSSQDDFASNENTSNSGNYSPPARVEPAPPVNTAPPPTNVTPTPPLENKVENGWLMHTVQKGETLYRLYVKYNVPVEEIRRLNGLPNNNIKLGQRLKIKRQ